MSIYKRGEKWRVVIDLERDENGKYPRRSIGNFATKKEAQVAEREALHAKDRGIDLSPGTVTITELMQRYLDDCEPRCEPKTIERYQGLSRLHIIPFIGRHSLAKLKPAHVSEWLKTIRERGSARSGPLAPKTVRHAYGLLSSALRWAVRMQLATRNVCEAVKAPPVPRSDAKALSEDEIRKLFDTVKGTRWEAFLILAFSLGARRGELCGLSWDDVNFEAGTVTIARSLSQTKAGGLCLKTTKTGRTRTILLPRFALDALKRQRAAQAAEKLAAGSLYQDEGAVFADELGKRGTPMKATCAFERLARKAGISTTRLHDVRHTAATRLLVGGTDLRTVSSIIGHANASTTLNIYAHVLADAQREAVDRLGAFLERQAQA